MERTQTAPRPRSVPPRLAHARRTSGSPMHTTAARLLGQSQERERGRGESLAPFCRPFIILAETSEQQRAGTAQTEQGGTTLSAADPTWTRQSRKTDGGHRRRSFQRGRRSCSKILPHGLEQSRSQTEPPLLLLPPPLPPFLPPSLFLAALLPSFLRRSPGTAARVAPLRRLELRRALARSDQDGRRRRFAA